MDYAFDGSWGDDVSWEVFTTQTMPPKELITTAFCVAITGQDEIVLTRPERGWGLLGGHIEAGESAEDALLRESVEEGGFTPARPQLFAIMKVRPTKPILKPQSSHEYYPFPVSYQLYYWATSDQPITAPTGQEILESRSFSMPAIEQLAIPDLRIIKLGYQAYLRSK